MTDLDKLIDAVEVSNPDNNWKPIAGYSSAKWGYCERAYHGSLDAAKALHEAMLPGWKWGVVDHADGDFGSGVGTKDFDDFLATSSNPARAWLLAILKAYRSQQ